MPALAPVLTSVNHSTHTANTHTHTQYEHPIQRGRDADATEKQVERGLAAMGELMGLINNFMLRRTSTVLKKLLPAKVEQVGHGAARPATACLLLMRLIVLFQTCCCLRLGTLL